MFAKFTKCLLSFYLVVFLIGGGRVCACDAFSWIGIDIHSFASDHHTGHCGGDHSDDVDHHEHDHLSHGDDSEDECPSNQCCELALQPFDAVTPQTVAVQEQLLEISFHSYCSRSDFRIGHNPFKKSWNDPPSAIYFQPLTLVLHQRFNL